MSYKKLIISTDPAQRVDLVARKALALKMVFVLLTNKFRAFSTTGYTFALSVKDSSGAEVLGFTDGDGLTVSTNEITLAKTAADMNLTEGQYTYEFTAELAGSKVAWLVGLFKVKAGVVLPAVETQVIGDVMIKRVNDLLIGICYE